MQVYWQEIQGFCEASSQTGMHAYAIWTGQAFEYQMSAETTSPRCVTGFLSRCPSAGTTQPQCVASTNFCIFMLHCTQRPGKCPHGLECHGTAINILRGSLSSMDHPLSFRVKTILYRSMTMEAMQFCIVMAECCAYTARRTNA